MAYYTAGMPKPPPGKHSRFAAIPPGASFEDDAQLDDTGHAWNLSYGDFLGVVCQRYGFVLDEEDGILRSPDGQRVIELQRSLAVEDPLDQVFTRLLCLEMGIPPEDFGLAAEEIEEDGEWPSLA